jgi:hypothetical protein
MAGVRLRFAESNHIVHISADWASMLPFWRRSGRRIASRGDPGVAMIGTNLHHIEYELMLPPRGGNDLKAVLRSLVSSCGVEVLTNTTRLDVSATRQILHIGRQVVIQ